MMGAAEEEIMAGSCTSSANSNPGGSEDETAEGDAADVKEEEMAENERACNNTGRESERREVELMEVTAGEGSHESEAPSINAWDGPSRSITSP